MHQTLAFQPGPEVHPSSDLTIKGLLSSTGVVNFLGIPYATIPARFRQSRLLRLENAVHGIDGNQKVLEATEYGPICLQPLDPLLEERLNLYRGGRELLLDENGKPAMDVEGCLRVNIHTPPEALRPGAKKLPVYAWIHGGGWTIGDGNFGAEGNFLVQKAIQIGKPFISVGINYRLGFHGFLTSKGLEEESIANGETYFANKGLHDQRIALQWIQTYIQYFGGNPDEVTIAGESAGGWCVLAHLLSNVPVCKRGIISSSPIWTFPPPEDSQKTFDRLVDSTGIPPTASDKDKLTALRSLTDAQLETLLNGAYQRPSWDPNWFVYQQDSTIPLQNVKSFPSWVQGIIFGWMKDEMALWSRDWIHLTPLQMEQWVLDISPDPSFSAELIRSYRIGSKYTGETDQDSFRGLLQLATDSIYGQLPLMIAGSVPSPTINVFRFDQPDRFPQSQFRGYAYHSIDIAFIERAPPVAGIQADPEDRETADQVTEAFADFIYSETLWSPFNKDESIKLFNGHKSCVKPYCDLGQDAQRWKDFVNTNERARWYGIVGRKLLAGKRDFRKQKD